MKFQVLSKEISKLSALFSGLKSDKLLILAQEDGIMLKAHDEVEFVLSTLITPVLESGCAGVGIKDFFEACKDLDQGDNVIEVSTKVPGSRKVGLHFSTEHGKSKSTKTQPRDTALEKDSGELTIFEVSEVISSFELDASVISEIVKRSIYSTDMSKPALNGIQIEQGLDLRTYSTNGNAFIKLVLADSSIAEPLKKNLHHRSWISAQKLAKAATGLEEDNTGRIQVEILENNFVRFQAGEHQIVSRILTDNLPDLAKMFNPLPPHRLTFTTEDRKLFKPLRRIEGNIRVTLGSEGMVLSAENEAESGQVTIPLDVRQETKLILTHEFFAVVDAITTDTFTLYYHSPGAEGYTTRPIALISKADSIDYSVLLGVIQPRLTR